MGLTTRDEIREWLVAGRSRGATHVVVACNTFDNEDYPVFVMPDDDVRAVAAEYDSRDMSRVMEVYDLSRSWVDQLAEDRAFNY